MTVTRSRWSLLVVAGLVGMLGTARPSAEDGRDFAGTFEISHAVEAAGKVSLTLTVEVVNYSGDDVYHARVVIDESVNVGQPLGAFVPADIAYRRGERFSGTFVVPVPEFRLWEKSTPHLSVEFVDRNGALASRPVELRSVRFDEEAF